MSAIPGAGNGLAGHAGRGGNGAGANADRAKAVDGPGGDLSYEQGHSSSATGRHAKVCFFAFFFLVSSLTMCRELPKSVTVGTTLKKKLYIYIYPVGTT